MNWIITSLLMFTSSIFLYLLIRKIQILKISNEINTLFQFGIPCLIYLIFHIFLKINIFIDIKLIILFSLAGFLFSYLGNKSSLIAIENAPNPGYSLIISKSYVVMTTFVSVIFFNSQLNIKSLLAIFLIIIFSSLIMISGKIKSVHNLKWIIFSFGSFFAWGFLALFSKYVSNLKVPVFTFLFYLTLTVSIFNSIELKLKKINLRGILLGGEKLLILFFIGIFGMLFNTFMQISYKYAPNPGYINAVNASSISLITLFSAFLFKDDFSLKKLIGILGVTTGLILLFI